jgi:hypothetical protein
MQGADALMLVAKLKTLATLVSTKLAKVLTGVTGIET